MSKIRIGELRRLEERVNREVEWAGREVEHVQRRTIEELPAPPEVKAALAEIRKAKWEPRYRSHVAPASSHPTRKTGEKVVKAAKKRLERLVTDFVGRLYTEEWGDDREACRTFFTDTIAEIHRVRDEAKAEVG